MYHGWFRNPGINGMLDTTITFISTVFALWALSLVPSLRTASRVVRVLCRIPWIMLFVCSVPRAFQRLLKILFLIGCQRPCMLTPTILCREIKRPYTWYLRTCFIYYPKSVVSCTYYSYQTRKYVWDLSCSANCRTCRSLIGYLIRILAFIRILVLGRRPNVPIFRSSLHTYHGFCLIHHILLLQPWK